jgi:hypothetical protein
MNYNGPILTTLYEPNGDCSFRKIRGKNTLFAEVLKQQELQD